jgi:hypothetical protein
MDKKIQHSILVIITWVYLYNISSVFAAPACSEFSAAATTGSADPICIDANNVPLINTEIGTITVGAGIPTTGSGTGALGIGATATSGTETEATDTAVSGVEVGTAGTLTAVSVSVPETGTGTTETIGSGTEATGTAGLGTGIKRKNKLGVLKISYLNLSFKQGGKSKILYKGTKQRAIAKLSSTGSGNIKIRWEIARPPFSNRSNPLFSLIKQEQKIVVGHQQKVFSSPVLPSQQVGLYLLRVSVINSAAEKQQSALIRYSILPAKQNIAIQLLSPAAAATINKSTPFNWRIKTVTSQAANIQIFTAQSPHKDCKIAAPQKYSVEIATQKTNQASITPIAAQQLKQGQHYCWRVQAYRACCRTK